GNRGGYRLLDEVDLLLLDEALTPFVLAGATKRKAPLADLDWSARVAQKLEPVTDANPNGHYRIGTHRVQLTQAGREFIRSLDEFSELGGRKFTPVLARRVENALTAKLVVKRDVHYIREPGGRITIIDQATGNKLDGRRWSDGLHEAVEFAEGVEIGDPTRVIDSMTIAEFLGDG